MTTARTARLFRIEHSVRVGPWIHRREQREPVRARDFPRKHREFAAANSRSARGLRRSFLALHPRGIDRATELFDRLRTDKELVADHEARRRARSGSLSAIVIALNPRLHLSGLNTLAPPRDIDALGARKRVEEACRRR